MRLRTVVAALIAMSLAGTALAVDFNDLKKLLPGRKDAGGGDAQSQDNKTDLTSLPSIFRDITPEEEAAIGRQIAGTLLGAAPLIKDEAVQAYVNRVGRWVASQSERPDLKWTFGVIESEDVNAFAAPGGYVFITKGLYDRLQDEAQLAGVLGHEIGHVQQKHHIKVIQKQKMMNLGTLVLSTQIKGEKMIQKLIGSGAEIMARGLDKSAEFEADRVGVVLATRAGYDPYGLPATLQDLNSIAKSAGSVALLFKTHPAPEERIAALSDAMGTRFDDVKGGKLAAERLVHAQ